MDGKVPVKKDGGLWFRVPYPSPRNLAWEKPEEFDAVMKVVSYMKTHMGSFYLWADDQNSTYPMVPEEMALVPGYLVAKDEPVDATWTFVQHGDKYSLKFVSEI